MTESLRNENARLRAECAHWRAEAQALAYLILSENVIVHERHVEHADRLLAPYLGTTE